MKKNLLLLPLLVASFGLAACQNTNNANKDYFVVNFNYNTEDNKTNYLSVVVLKDQVLEAPKNPTLKDLLFEDWYKEPSCKNKYLRWGLEIDKDFTLYANWTSFESASIDLKVSLFQEQLKKLGRDASRVEQSCEATIAYPTLTEQIFSVHDKYIYKRYKTLTEKEYYSVDEGKLTLYGKEQYRYDNRYFYDVYVDLEDASNNETNTSAFKEENIEGFISIDFQNLFHTCENSIVYYANSDKYDENTFDYSFTGNGTAMDEAVLNGSYSYEEGFAVAKYSDSIGNYVTEEYEYKFGLTFENGKIRSAKVETAYLFAIGESEIYQYVVETSIYDFYYNNGLYPDFTGTIL